MSRALRTIDGRWLTAMIVAGYFIFLAAGREIFHLQLWEILGVPALPVPFHDLNDIAIGIERFRASEHPWSEASIVYSTQAYNYTKWWLCASYLGLDLKTVYVFGVSIGISFFACALFVLGRLTLIEGGIAGLVLISPNVMTAIERANADLIVFILMTLALALRRSVPLFVAIITVAAFLKFYPLAALLALVALSWRKTLFWLLVAIALVTIDLATSLGELHQIAANVTRVGWFSYGSTTMMEGYWVTTLPGSPVTYNQIFIVGSFLFLMVVGASIWKRPHVKVNILWERELWSFRIGAALFVGTFALGSNLDHRTVILVFDLPLLFLLRKESGSIALWATAALFCIVLYTNGRLLWNDAVPLFFFLKQLTAWLLVVFFTGIFAATIDLSPIKEKS